MGCGRGAGLIVYIVRRSPHPKRQGYEIDDWWDTGGPEQITVHEEDDSPRPIGLFDEHGNEICRVPDRVPMGFRK